VADEQENLLTAPAEDEDGPAPSELERIHRANRRYLERYRENGRIMGVIEEVSRYDTFVHEARLRRQKHFAERAEASIRRLQKEGAADPDVDPAIAAVALGSMVARFAEVWLVEEWEDFDFDQAAEQLTRLWANAIGLHEPKRRGRRN
jgi:AcrR family transcriptional regulator